MIRKCLHKQFGLIGLLSLLLLTYSGYLQAQNQGSVRTVRVLDKTSQSPLAGATVTNLKSQTSASSTAQGTLQIQAATGDSLRITMLGYDALTLIVSSANIDVQLSAQQQAISEVVVTALGIKRETRGLTFATQQLEAEAVNDVRDNSGNIMSSLTGKVAGAVVTTSSAGPGSAVRVVLRGNKSISGNNNALVVVDGVPYDNSAGPQAAGTTPNYGTSDGAANINPDDIESINILKGPSAAALYGSRAANGAIIITTKQGSEGRYQIDYNGGVSLDQVNLLSKFQ